MQYLPPSKSLRFRMLQHRKRRRRQRRLKYKADTNDNCRVFKSCQDRNRFKYMNDQGVWETLSPKKTCWNLVYLQSPQIGDIYHEKKFRDRFRLPYKSFKEPEEHGLYFTVCTLYMCFDYR